MKLDVTLIMASELDVAFWNVSCYNHRDLFSTCRQFRTLFYLAAQRAASFKQSHSSTLVIAHDNKNRKKFLTEWTIQMCISACIDICGDESQTR